MTRHDHNLQTASTVLLEPVSAFGRTFYLGTTDGDLVAMISPKNMFSRKAEIDIKASDAEFPTIVFAFWLTIILWRRAAGAAGAAAGG